jgi:hypothetical protein
VRYGMHAIALSSPRPRSVEIERMSSSLIEHRTFEHLYDPASSPYVLQIPSRCRRDPTRAQNPT